LSLLNSFIFSSRHTASSPLPKFDFPKIHCLQQSNSQLQIVLSFDYHSRRIGGKSSISEPHSLHAYNLKLAQFSKRLGRSINDNKDEFGNALN